MKDLIALLRKKTTPLFHWIIDYALQLTEIGKQKRTEINTPAPRNREIMTGNIKRPRLEQLLRLLSNLHTCIHNSIYAGYVWTNFFSRVSPDNSEVTKLLRWWTKDEYSPKCWRIARYAEWVKQLVGCNPGLLNSVGNAVNVRIDNLHWILDISSRWSEVLFFSAPIKRKHGY